MEKDIDKYAKIIWDYMHLHHDVQKADIIFALGSHDTSVAERAADLYLKGFAPYIVCSGNKGKNTEHLFNATEAEIFAEIIMKKGVPKKAVFLEKQATNTGENILFTKALLKEKGTLYNSFILVGKPYMERRTYASFTKQWPHVDFCVTSPQISYEDYINKSVEFKEQAIAIMVGDLQRIREYPKQGFQIEQKIPDSVWAAWKELVSLGYTRFLI